MLRYVFWSASFTEGGLTQAVDGHTTPEAYATEWLKALSLPVTINDRKIMLEFGALKNIPGDDDTRKRVLQSLRDDGYPVVATTLEAGSMEVSLYADFCVYRSIFSKNREHFGPWQLFGDKEIHNLGDLDMRLAYEPQPSKMAYTPPTMYRLDSDNMLVRQDDGTLRLAGWDYQVVSSYVKACGEIQLSHPGSFRDNIKALRKAVKAAPKVDADVLVDFSSHKTSEGAEYRTERLLEIAAKLGKPDLNFSITWGELKAKAAELKDDFLFYSLMDCHDLVWTLPQGAPATATQEEMFS